MRVISSFIIDLRWCKHPFKCKIICLGQLSRDTWSWLLTGRFSFCITIKIPKRLCLQHAVSQKSFFIYLITFFHDLFNMQSFLLYSMFKQLTTNAPHHIETSQMICSANQLTGFLWWGTLVVNGLNKVCIISQIKSNFQ